MNLGEILKQRGPMFPPVDGSKFIWNPFTLQIRHKERWGWVIYRTDYSSDEDWAKFREMFATWTTVGCPPADWAVGRTVRAWQQMWWQDDKNQFENASVEDLRGHFLEWLATLEHKETQITCPEHYMFMVVDREVLQNIHAQNPEIDNTVRDEDPYVKAYDSNSSINDNGYPGWMKVALDHFYSLYFEGLSHTSMRGLRSRCSEWFDPDVHREETYL